MMQFSIYVCLAKNSNFAQIIIEKIQKNTPKNGDIRCLLVTERQYQNIKFFRGKKSYQEKLIDLKAILEI